MDWGVERLPDPFLPTKDTDLNVGKEVQYEDLDKTRA